ncbi:MAG: GNAT family N-acetyltransferase [Bacteroidaceae bacterium]|nr:GNAT family N-acetyltransferase [Bacteroidaceae bacterium]
MIRIIGSDNCAVWDNIVRGFKNHDVYYLNGYVKAFQKHGDGEPQLFFYEVDRLKAIYVFMKRKTSIEGYYDSITPYGYGGVLFEGDTCKENLQAFRKEFVAKMREEDIVDNFVRYHPVLANAVPMKSISTVIDMGKTVAMDLSSADVIWDNITSKNRNMIRKAEKNGIEIFHGKGLQLLQEFKRIYNATMEKDLAEEYYFFGDAFYESIHNDLHDNYEVFYAVKDCMIIAISIMLFANGRMNYHLSGSVMKYRNLAPSNLLLYRAALWGCEQGFVTFHLGGGVGSGEDNLYKFKTAFNRNSNYQFSIGKEIFDQNKYDILVSERAQKSICFNKDSSFFPLYRT